MLPHLSWAGPGTTGQDGENASGRKIAVHYKNNFYPLKLGGRVRILGALGIQQLRLDLCVPVPCWLGAGLPVLIDEVHGQDADDEAQASNEQVVDGTDMLHLQQLAAGTAWEGPQVWVTAGTSAWAFCPSTMPKGKC